MINLIYIADNSGYVSDGYLKILRVSRVLRLLKALKLRRLMENI